MKILPASRPWPADVLHAQLKSRLFLGGLFGGVIGLCFGLFGYGIVYCLPRLTLRS